MYAQVYDELQDKWIWVDPMRRSINTPPSENRVIFGEGLDSWDLGIEDYESLRRSFELFRDDREVESSINNDGI